MTFEEVLNRDGKLIYTNKGVSMMPLLRQDKDLLVIEKCNPKTLKKYDAVLFVRNGQGKKNYVLHRILKVNQDGSYWIVGDHCTSGERVEASQILGKLTQVYRNQKTIKVEDKAYLFYVHLWCDFYPIRFFLLKCKSLFYRFFSKIRRCFHCE